jgi:GAF domain-containing protein
MFNVKEELSALFEGEKSFLANSSNFCAYFFNKIEDVNWLGFYFVDGKDLVLGPFQGKPACIRISIGNGVCGTSALQCKTVIVDNVHEFPGHIPCDAASNSEIVLPLIYQGKLFGVLDIDSPVYNRFTHDDSVIFAESIDILIESSDIKSFLNCYN